MKIVTWNVNSLKARKAYVEKWLDAEDPDVLCVQELKLDGDKVPAEIFTERGYDVAIHGQPQWNGVLIASKTPLEDVAKGLPDGDEGESRLIAATTEGIRFVNLYCPQGQSADSPKFAFKLGFYKALRAWLAETCDPSKPLVVLGDMNVAPEARDIWSEEVMHDVPTYHPLEHEEWGKLTALGLHDAVKPFVEPGTFSFWDYRGGAFPRNMGMRIDHVLVTEPLVGRVEDAFIQRPYRKKWDGLTPSDHAPVGIVLA
ncbi:MAG: exodeoxyribonuclease III [Myxococcota bacterium]